MNFSSACYRFLHSLALGRNDKKPRSTRMVWHEIGLWWPGMRQTPVWKVASAAVECVEWRFRGRPFWEIPGQAGNDVGEIPGQARNEEGAMLEWSTAGATKWA